MKGSSKKNNKRTYKDCITDALSYESTRKGEKVATYPLVGNHPSGGNVLVIRGCVQHGKITPLRC